MKKFISLCAMLIVTFMSSIVSAEVDSQTLLNDIKNNPQNYFYIGSAGTGLMIYISKSSVNVQKYAPPKYIISVDWIIRSSRSIKEGENWREIEGARIGGTHRYLYDYNERKIYAEKFDDKQNANWEFLDTKFANGGVMSSISTNINAAELIFDFAYNQSFFNEPVSDTYKYYIKNKKSLL